VRSLDLYFLQRRYHISSLFIASLGYLSPRSVAVLLASSCYYLITSRPEIVKRRRKKNALACFNVRDHGSSADASRIIQETRRAKRSKHFLYRGTSMPPKRGRGILRLICELRNYDKSFVRHSQICMRRISVNAMRARFIVIVVGAPAVFWSC